MVLKLCMWMELGRSGGQSGAREGLGQIPDTFVKYEAQELREQGGHGGESLGLGAPNPLDHYPLDQGRQ